MPAALRLGPAVAGTPQPPAGVPIWQQMRRAVAILEPRLRCGCCRAEQNASITAVSDAAQISSTAKYRNEAAMPRSLACQTQFSKPVAAREIAIAHIA